MKILLVLAGECRYELHTCNELLRELEAIEKNEGKGINFRNSTIDIVDNIIRHNSAGIFLFETDRPPTIAHNNIYANTDGATDPLRHSDLALLPVTRTRALA